MPHRYRHIRNGPRSVRPEFHVLMHTLKSELPLSEVQAQGARIGVANILFGRKDFGEGKSIKNDKYVFITLYLLQLIPTG